MAGGSSPHGRGTPSTPRRRGISSTVHPRTGGEHWIDGSHSGRPSGSSRTGGEHCMPYSLGTHPTGSSPHGRGTRGSRADSPPTIGSSPHGRGTLELRRHGPVDLRFIPARAGNTSMRSQRSRTSAVHPRTAGNTTTAGSTRIARSVHPRTGGEHDPARRIEGSSVGSSPHGRGTQQRRQAAGVSLRFIPARAGNTRFHFAPPTESPVHPRTGGEHSSMMSATITSFGSSPHGRGTLARRGMVQWSSVHPRTGGEHYVGMKDFRGDIGSSPHGRGTHSPRFPSVAAHRFIPARAGNTE